MTLPYLNKLRFYRVINVNLFAPQINVIPAKQKRLTTELCTTYN